MGGGNLCRLPLRRQHRKGQPRFGARYRPLRADNQTTRRRPRRVRVSNYSASIVSSDSQENNHIRANYQFTNLFEDRTQSGWVEIRVANNHIQCLVYWDYPRDCRKVGGVNTTQVNIMKEAAKNYKPPTPEELELDRRLM